jgi:fucose permease
MGISGAAVIPPLYGHFVDIYSAQTSYLILLPIYLFIFYYAVWGHKLRKATA